MATTVRGPTLPARAPGDTRLRRIALTVAAVILTWTALRALTLFGRPALTRGR